MRKFIHQTPHSFKCVLVFATGELIASLVYPPLCEYARSHRLSDAPGGEVLLWLAGLLLAVAYDTYKKGRSSGGKKKAKCN